MGSTLDQNNTKQEATNVPTTPRRQTNMDPVERRLRLGSGMPFHNLPSPKPAPDVPTTKTTHTPGPEETDRQSFCMSTGTMRSTDHVGYIHVVSGKQWDRINTAVDRSRLIAAAPKMLERLRLTEAALLVVLKNRPNDERMKTFIQAEIENIRAVTSQATGE